MLTKFLKDESGATAIEYGLIAALVAVASITAFHSLGQTIAGIFGDIDIEVMDAAELAAATGKR